MPLHLYHQQGYHPLDTCSFGLYRLLLCKTLSIVRNRRVEDSNIDLHMIFLYTSYIFVQIRGQFDLSCRISPRSFWMSKMKTFHFFPSSCAHNSEIYLFDHFYLEFSAHQYSHTGIWISAFGIQMAANPTTA